jgi:hypothetical protein
MHKIFIGISAAALTAGLGMTTVLAKGNTEERPVPAVSFVDAEGDGVCDNAGNGQCCGKGQNYVDADGDGVCDNAGNRQCRGNGQNYVDANNDGICDNAGSGTGACRRAGWNK